MSLHVSIIHWRWPDWSLINRLSQNVTDGPNVSPAVTPFATPIDQAPLLTPIDPPFSYKLTQKQLIQPQGTQRLIHEHKEHEKNTLHYTLGHKMIMSAPTNYYLGHCCTI